MGGIYHGDECYSREMIVGPHLSKTAENPVKNKTVATLAENIAPIEFSPALAAHAVNTQLLYNEVLYDVISAIAVGDTLTINTNIAVADSVLEQIDARAEKSDLTSIFATGSTNATGNTISSGTYFYLNGTLVRAKADIASGAAFTENTNYEEVTAGALNNLYSALNNAIPKIKKETKTFTADQYGQIFFGYTNQIQVLGANVKGTHDVLMLECYEGTNWQSNGYRKSGDMSWTPFVTNTSYQIVYVYLDKGIS